MADEPKRRGGGPKTPEGKARASQNSTRHGLRSQTIRLLPWEEQSDYDAVVAGWNEYWQPEDFQEEKLVKTLIYNDWMHRRAERWLAEAEATVAEENENPLDWTPEQERKLQLLQRYKTSAERAFYRAWSVLEGLRKDTMRRDLAFTKLQGLAEGLQNKVDRLESQKPEAKAQAQATKKKQNKITTCSSGCRRSFSMPESKDVGGRGERSGLRWSESASAS